MSNQKQQNDDPTTRTENETAESQNAVHDQKSDAEQPLSDKPAEIEADSIESLKSENEELKDRLLRTMAEMENLRRRTEREKADTAKYVISNFARDVLNIGDNIQRAIDSVPSGSEEEIPALKGLLEGVEMTERELINMLERYDITRLDAKGEQFDPNKHQAMYEVPNDEVEAGTCVDVVQAGYMIGERVLRPALVGVSKGGEKSVKPPPPPAEKAAEVKSDQAQKKEPPPIPKTPKTETKPSVQQEPSATQQAQRPPKANPTKQAPKSDPQADAPKTQPGKPSGARVDKSA